jgi:hypothetical protein
MQMYGLLTIALTFPELEGSAEWRDYAVQTLVEAQRAQVRPDGVQVEQSPSYHAGCVWWFFEPMRLSELNGLSWPADYRERIERMCTFVLWITGPDGRLPALSDTDRSRSGLRVLAHGALLFDRPDFAAQAELTVRDAWIHGPEAVDRLVALRGRARPSGERLRHFTDAGYVVMRSGWDDRAGFAVFDCGPRGGGHGHYDLLNIEIHAFGKLLIADPGRWWYDDSPLRRELIGAPAHNTISLDGQNHAACEAGAADKYEILRAESRDGWICVHGRHRAYDQMKGPPVCERQVFYDGGTTWVVVDHVSSPEPHDVLVNYQFAVESAERVAPQAVVTTAGSDEPRVLILHEVRDGLTATIEPGTLSRVYGQKEPAARLRLRQTGERVQIVTVVHAFIGPDPPATSLDVQGEDPTEIRIAIGDRQLSLRP